MSCRYLERPLLERKRLKLKHDDEQPNMVSDRGTGQVVMADPFLNSTFFNSF